MKTREKLEIIEKADKNKVEALETALGRIEKDYGKGAVMRLGEISGTLTTECIPTGSLALDIALGIGGIPRGRVTEVFGAESAGKSTLAIHIMAETQKLGGIAAYIDVEHALDPIYAANCGLNLDDLLIAQPDSAEQALDITEQLVRSGAVDAVVVDSVAALVPQAEIEGDMGDTHVGLQARLMSQALRKLTSSIHRSRTAVIFINQIREKVGVTYGSPEVTPGGRALKFYSSVRVDLRRVESIKQGAEVMGNRVRARIVKNKVAAPFRVAEFDIMFNQGISKMGDILEIGVDQGVVKKSGAFYSYGETKLGQGRENSKDFLIQHPEIAESIEGRLRSPADEPVAEQPESQDGDVVRGSNSVADFLANNGLEQAGQE
ncbi:MAG: recombinase RecA [Chloroflexota bacterium]|jgi:recombination protein RecA|nr:recombinase RecA [Chloroflexota bacterium]GIS94222.1 MAG: protein RecA [Dehalococcoidia bacterium]|tara:strand:- start:3689 stop:4819 length:1131 start_codon:yes stop_codon:yes gene_type:complete